MLVLTRAPMRVSFFGGGTDHPLFFGRERGAVLGAALGRYVHLAVSDLPGCFNYRVRVAYSRLELVDSAAEVAHPAVRACLDHCGIEAGVEIVHFADLPARTGLGTSSAFTVALLLALRARGGHIPGPAELAREAVFIEREKLGEPGGWQDQWFAAYGGLQRLDFQPGGRVSLTAPPLGKGVARGLERDLVLYYTGLVRDSGRVFAQQAARGDALFPVLRKALALVDKGERCLSEPWDPERFGRLLEEAWQLKRAFSPAVCPPEVERLYVAARRAGAAGGKLLGAGGGGFLLLCVPPERRAAVAEALGRPYAVPFRVARLGARVLHREPDEEA